MRHVERVTDLSTDEWAGLWNVGRFLARRLSGAGFTFGINDGPAAGQTVPHVHLHLIPHTEEVPARRGGIRWVRAATANYWTKRRAA